MGPDIYFVDYGLELSTVPVVRYSVVAGVISTPKLCPALFLNLQATARTFAGPVLLESIALVAELR